MEESFESMNLSDDDTYAPSDKSCSLFVDRMEELFQSPEELVQLIRSEPELYVSVLEYIYSLDEDERLAYLQVLVKHDLEIAKEYAELLHLDLA